MRGLRKRFVYVFGGGGLGDHDYVGIASDPERRLEWHHHGPCGHTVANRPWAFAVVVESPTEHQAIHFERYLKSGSGRAFAARHFKPSGFGQVEAARRMGIPLNRFNEIIRRRRGVSANTALRLARLLNTSAEIWLGLRNDWDPWHAAHAMRKAG